MHTCHCEYGGQRTTYLVESVFFYLYVASRDSAWVARLHAGIFIHWAIRPAPLVNFVTWKEDSSTTQSNTSLQTGWKPLWWLRPSTLGQRGQADLSEASRGYRVRPYLLQKQTTNKTPNKPKAPTIDKECRPSQRRELVAWWAGGTPPLAPSTVDGACFLLLLGLLWELSYDPFSVPQHILQPTPIHLPFLEPAVHGVSKPPTVSSSPHCEIAVSSSTPPPLF